MPPAYTATQKSAITQFMSFTSSDRNTAVKHLKLHNWNSEQAVNGYFSGGGAASAPSGSSKSGLNKVFDKYRDDKTTPDTIGVTGMMSYLNDIKVELEDIGMLAVSEIIQCPTMGEMTREGFTEGWSAYNCDTVDKQKSHMKNLLKTLPSNKDTFTRIYKYTYNIGRTGNQKSVQLDTAIEYWKVLFGSASSPVRWNSHANPWLDWWVEFLTTKWKKSVNKDVWNETLKFANMTLEDESLGFWTEESSWPSVVDEFVEWVKEKRGGDEGEAMEVE
ncbi:DUF298-domain-containing protein [Mytilinidion resinicola]|uniref:Defective in cullin neddylation protein n=1 Tax=Mytilinidion resinicola TaxID=574789 RepID=A0A6A6YKB1_9PEZI|nr:DUF298-domain-containing protein [Mytilinidion resinicola]KAF2809230.1 DUF298-domain-containing protein [Mytilinidion resinicola]